MVAFVLGGGGGGGASSQFNEASLQS